MLENQEDRMESSITWLALFTTAGTLVCCALPITLAFLGMGASMAALASNVPGLIALSQYKLLIFTLSGILLTCSGWLLYRSNLICPSEPELAALCERSRTWNRRIFWFSIGLWALGFFAAFLALPLKIWLER